MILAPMAESTSLSYVVSSTAWNTGTLSSVTDSKMEGYVKGLSSCQNEMGYSLIYNEVC